MWDSALDFNFCDRVRGSKLVQSRSYGPLCVGRRLGLRVFQPTDTHLEVQTALIPQAMLGIQCKLAKDARYTARVAFVVAIFSPLFHNFAPCAAPPPARLAGVMTWMVSASVPRAARRVRQQRPICAAKCRRDGLLLRRVPLLRVRRVAALQCSRREREDLLLTRFLLDKQCTSVHSPLTHTHLSQWCEIKKSRPPTLRPAAASRTWQRI